ncbi:nuclease-related domain-containing protein [Endozoicomonas sp. 4G]|uniref:nuclease-related domain-containing protein n=1 Tax=Endozoicomonas sp. 4G TaxID=2872754 RepID=UPI002078C635|nr:nuclease-related domain-containing protein [Endozoicomonas sp. 4G]
MKGLLKFGLFGFLFVLFVTVIADPPSYSMLYLYTATFMLLFLIVAAAKAIVSTFRAFFSQMDKKIAPDEIDQKQSSQQNYDARNYHRKHGYDRRSSDSPASQNTVDSEFEEIKTPFNDHKDAGNFGEAKVRAVLSELKGKVIYGFIGSQNIFYAGKNFEIDFVISVPGVGFIMTEVKYHSGQIFCDNTPMWRQIKTNGSTYDYKNASKQVIRTRGLFKRLLTDHDMNKWPIKTVVIYAHKNAVIYPAMSPDNPQTDVVKLENLESWIKSLPRNDLISMTREEHKQVEVLIERHHREYEAA